MSQNLTAIKWDHAVNNRSLLHTALESNINMIEADVVLGTLINGTNETLPIMGHPPAITSDITLKEFLEQINNYNNLNKNKTKGVKLDFKTIEVFEGSIGILKNITGSIAYPLWLNADILSGPLNNTVTIPVNANRFLNTSRQFPKSLLSIGWTTTWGENFKNGSYTEAQINLMIQTIKTNNITNDITFPVRAGIAAQSLPQLENLLKTFNTTNNATLTIWSSVNDFVNITQLEKLIKTIGVNKVYLDVPVEVSSKMNLGNSGSVIGKMSFLSLILIFMSIFFMNY